MRFRIDRWTELIGRETDVGEFPKKATYKSWCYDWHGSPPKLSKRRRVLRLTLLVLGYYRTVPLIIFDFSETAYSFDEEYFNGRDVAIGPKPYFLVPGSIRDFDYPGGPDYTKTAWPFVVWKPLCVLYCRLKGCELPRSWR